MSEKLAKKNNDEFVAIEILFLAILEDNQNEIANILQKLGFNKEKTKKWYFWATHCQLKPMIKVAKTIKNHWNGIIRWKTSYTNSFSIQHLFHFLSTPIRL